MRDFDASYMATLSNAPETGIVPRTLVSVTGHEFANEDAVGATVRYDFWTDDDNVAITVTSGITGTASTRTFIGGVNLEVESIPRVSDLTIQTVSIRFSQLADAVQAMVRGTDMRLAKVEIFEALFDPTTRQLVSEPPLSFLGEVDGSPIETPAVDGEGGIEINVVSDAINMLTRKNPQKSSDASQSRREDDEFNKDAAVIGTWDIDWGQKSGA